MGGTVLELKSEREYRLGKEEGINDTIYQLISKGSISEEEGADFLDISVRQLRLNMKAMGYSAL